MQHMRIVQCCVTKPGHPGLQVLRVAQSDADVTVFFHPNVADAELSADSAASFVCEFPEPQVLPYPCLHQYMHATVLACMVR